MTSLEEGTAGVGDGSAKHSQLSGRLAGVPQRFLELLNTYINMNSHRLTYIQYTVGHFVNFITWESPLIIIVSQF